MKSYRYMADISSNNGTVDIANYSRAGHVMLAIKATEGDSYINPLHLSQCHTAHSYGLSVIHYHFCRPEDGAGVTNELAHFRNTYLKGWRKGDSVAIDLEVDAGAAIVVYANAFCEDIAKLTGHLPILYTYRSYAEDYLKGVKVPGGRLWIADYSHIQPAIKRPNSLFAWQYTDGKNGPEPHFYSGIGKCDGSILNARTARNAYIRKITTKGRRK